MGHDEVCKRIGVSGSPVQRINWSVDFAGIRNQPGRGIWHQLGDDYKLINYTQFETYIKKLERVNPRASNLVAMGPTAEGRTQWMTVITSPENHAKLDHYKSISARLAHAEGIDEESRAGARRGRQGHRVD